MTYDEWILQVESILIHGLDMGSWEVFWFMTNNLEVLRKLFEQGLTPSRTVFDIMH